MPKQISAKQPSSTQSNNVECRLAGPDEWGGQPGNNFNPDHDSYENPNRNNDRGDAGFRCRELRADRRKKSLNLEGAKKAIAAAVDYAKKNNASGGVIAVVDEGGNLMALERLDGTFAMGATISIGKARTAVLFKRPTRFFEELINI